MAADEQAAAASRVPPHSVEAEQAVLGALLLDNRVHERVGDVLRAADFYRGEHRLIWAAADRLIQASKPADEMTVYAALQAAGMADNAGGLAYITQLAGGVASAGNAVAYARIVLQRSLCRRAMALGQDLVDQARSMAGDEAGLQQVLDGAAGGLLALTHGAAQDEPQVIKALLPEWLDMLERRAQGHNDAMPIGFGRSDRVLSGGLRRGEVTVIGARPSMGKSALMLQIARNVAKAVPVLVCSLEDSLQMLVSREVASAGRVQFEHVRLPQHAPASMWERVSEGVEALMPLPLYLDDRAGLGLRDVRRKALQVRRVAGGLGLVVVDYLQLMDGDGNTRSDEIAQLARGAKRLAKDLDCAVLLLSQLSREADKMSGPPRLDHLAEGGGIEQAADNIGLLWREARAKPTPDNKHRAQIEWAKVKNGATRTVRMYFDGTTQWFADEDSNDAD